ncbi:energy transducer TonB [Lysobacter tyrosinilyticus]
MNVRIGWNAALGIVLLLLSQATFAGGAGAVRKQIESSMLLTGKIQVDTEGHVTGHSLDDAEKIPSGVVALIEKAVPLWVFKPMLLDGKPVHVATDMRIRVGAHKLDAGQYEVGILSATFGNRSGHPRERIQVVDLTPPAYPMGAAEAGLTGTVYLLLRVGRDGKVTDAIAEQTNLTIVDSEKAMARWRRALEGGSISQARKWLFVPPTHGEAAKRDFWLVRVPLVYLGYDQNSAPYGTWQNYVPGPRRRSPWDDGDKEGVGFSPDTLAPGTAYLAGSGLQLLTPLSGS